MTPPWWAPVTAVSTSLACSGEDHEVRWENGALVFPAHADVEAERTLGALGASPPRCLYLCRVWEELIADPVLITLARRPGEADIGIASDPHGPTSLAADLRRRDAFLLLFSLPAPFIDRAALGAAASAAAKWSDAAFRSSHGLRLGAALSARAVPALRRLAGELAGPDEPLLVHCIPAGERQGPLVRAERTAIGFEVTASLPLGWIASVWGPGISEPDGAMVLAVRATGDGGARLEVDVAEWRPDGVDQWEAAGRQRTLVRSDEGAWHFA